MNLTGTVDALGYIKAQIADLEKKETVLKNNLIGLGTGSYEGNTFRATVSEYERALLDMAAVKAKLSPQFLAAHTTYTPAVKVLVSARNNLKLAA